MEIILSLLIVFVIIVAIAARPKPISIKGHWQTFLDGLQLPAVEFYEAVKAGLIERQITKVTLSEKSFLEKHILSAKRIYLRISQNEYVYYICAAPYGTGTFISSWFCIKDENVTNRIPVLSKLAGIDRDAKTFYQMDTEAMFQSAVHTTVVDAVNGMSEAKGQRGLSELEGQFTMKR